jgi:hypothetical protein
MRAVRLTWSEVRTIRMMVESSWANKEKASTKAEYMAARSFDSSIRISDSNKAIKGPWDDSGTIQ